MNFIKRLWAKLTIRDENLLEKKMATINNEPWVKVINVTLEDPHDPSKGSFELDWNDHFIVSLINSGYSGRNDSEVVDQWFNDLCRGVIGDNI